MDNDKDLYGNPAKKTKTQKNFYSFYNFACELPSAELLRGEHCWIALVLKALRNIFYIFTHSLNNRAPEQKPLSTIDRQCTTWDSEEDFSRFQLTVSNFQFSFFKDEI